MSFNKIPFIRILLIITFLLSATNITADDSFQRVQRTEKMMDTYFTITVYSDNPDTAEGAITEAFNKIKEIEYGLNLYNGDSELSRLNRKKILKSPSDDIRKNIERALYFSNLTNGAFDITVQPILDLYNRAFMEKGVAPAGETIKRELKRVDYRSVLVKEDSITIGDDQVITLGGIAKGYAVEEAVKILRRHNIAIALIDAGGNMRALGKKPEGVWNIAIEDPRDMSNYITIIPLNNMAVSTSGDYERYFDNNREYHHIINPKTGYSATELISATVVTDNAFDADALSTAVFVLGKEKGLKLIESMPGVEGLIITREREILRSSGFPEVKDNK
ncbi:MAG: FAD:protein FMN transferase [Deltaproteobacteria bacterium]|nr:FAD:protein FMN transferase [Deltaproteobacteria bacterium]